MGGAALAEYGHGGWVGCRVLCGGGGGEPGVVALAACGRAAGRVCETELNRFIRDSAYFLPEIEAIRWI